MIACDSCRDVSRRAGEYRVVLAKVVPGQQRASQVTVESAAVELCEGCATALFEKVKTVLPNGTVTNEDRA